MTNKDILSVRVDRQLFEDVKAMLRELDAGARPQRTNNEVPYGSLYTLIDTVLRDWLDHQRTAQRNTQHAREFAHHD